VTGRSPAAVRISSDVGPAETLMPPTGTHRADDQEVTMSKTGRKRRGRKKKAANHGKRPNA
jgi:hypothetical protein